MKKPKVILAAAICLTLVVAIVTGCAFAGAGDTPGENELTIEEEIIEAYYNTVENDSFRERYTTADLSLRFRGTFSDTYVVFVDGPYAYMAVMCSDVVGGIKFTYPDSHRMQAYHQGSFYSLPEAYELGFLTTDDVMQLKENYIAYGGTSLDSYSNKGEVPTTRQSCTHTPPVSAGGSEEAFAYTVSGAQYFYTGIDETRNVTVFTIRSADELVHFCGMDKSELDEKHNDSFFEKNSLIVINYAVDKSPFNLLVSGASVDTDGSIQIEIDSYAANPISALPKTGSIVLEVNRIVDDPQVKHAVTSHEVSEQEYRELFPDDPIYPLFNPDGLPLFDSLDYLNSIMASPDTWYARAATSLYDSAENVNLYDLFRDAYTQYKDFTDAELAYLKTSFLADFIGNLDIVKIPAKEMSSVLRQYFNISLEQANQVGTDSMVYFADTDSYYCVSNDVASAPLILHSAYYHTGFDYIYYDIGEADGYPDYVMVIEVVDGDLIIISNQKTPVA